jgi:hypothetical protein
MDDGTMDGKLHEKWMTGQIKGKLHDVLYYIR